MPHLLGRGAAVFLGVIALLSWSQASADPTGGTITIPGPKRTIGVGAIDVIGTYANASSTNAGGAVAAALTTRLEASGCCAVVERDAMGAIVTEMDLAKTHVSSGSAAPMPGSIIPAQYLVVGSVTAQSTADRGGGLSLGTGVTSLTLGGSSGEIELDLRLIDTRTSAVVTAFKVRHKLSSHNAGLTTNVSGVSVAPNAFFNTPQGEATDAALGDAVVQIAKALASQPWRGQVVKYDSGTLWANAGGEGGVSIGDRFDVERVGETLTDPATGAVLQQTMKPLGVVTITNVEPKIAWGAYQAAGPGDPSRGDFLVMRPK
jgi:curli biogenesis system outer membrane secretion channel CsgG